MTNIQTSTISLQATKIDLRVNQQIEAGKAGSFEALLSSFNSPSKTRSSSGLGNLNKNDQLYGLIDGLFENISSSLSDNLNGILSQFSSNNFAYTPSFTSTFGTSGPLPVYIATVTAKLNLSAKQQIALQDIAVNNKDIVKSPESVQKVAKELEAAGIGYA